MDLGFMLVTSFGSEHRPGWTVWCRLAGDGDDIATPAGGRWEYLFFFGLTFFSGR